MHISHVFRLPPAILALCATAASASATPESSPNLELERDLQWPHNVPRHLKYFPEHEHLARKSLNIQKRLQHEKPVGVRKMSTDEGEMFMLDNWIFAGDVQKRDTKDTETNTYANDTTIYTADSPLRPLAEQDFLARMHVRALLKRQYACPSGTNSCSSIGAPDVCCGTGSDCVKVENSPGVGAVGCCPRGQTCAGSISCDTKNGYSSCPDAPNGGCCIPGFRCDGIGCAAVGTSITYVLPSSSPPPSSTALIVIPTSPSSSTCTTGFMSCAASLGGGCCASGLTCASGTTCVSNTPSSSQAPPTSSTNNAPSAPVRPTSGSTTQTSETASLCPTGFYVCSAYYPTGCCRVGRDCQTTGSCILPSPTTIINTNGVVIVAPTGASVASAGNGGGKAGTCPSAWYSCPANRGGNCCPEGFECGEQCTATGAGQTGVQGKVAPSSKAAGWGALVSGWMVVLGSVGVGIAMVVL